MTPPFLSICPVCFDTLDKAVFDEYLGYVCNAALYDTGVTAEYGDQLLTFSTCSYHTADGGFVVVAKKRPDLSRAQPTGIAAWPTADPFPCGEAGPRAKMPSLQRGI